MKEINKFIGKQGEYAGFIIKTNHGVIHIDMEGNWWLGGNDLRIGIALFKIRKDAQKVAKKIKRQRSDLIRWTKTVPVYYCVIY